MFWPSWQSGPRSGPGPRRRNTDHRDDGADPDDDAEAAARTSGSRVRPLAPPRACAAGQLRAAPAPAVESANTAIQIDMANSPNGEQHNQSDRMRLRRESSSKDPSLSCEADSAAASEQQDGEEAESTTHTPHPPAPNHLEAVVKVENAARRASFVVSRTSFSAPTFGRRHMWRQHAVQHDEEHQQQLLGTATQWAYEYDRFDQKNHSVRSRLSTRKVLEVSQRTKVPH